jgi:hypothetical protein
MSVNTVGTSASNAGLDQLIQRTMAAIDTNGDGKLSTAEFGNFLTRILTNISGGANTLTAASSDTTPASGASVNPVFAGFDASRLQTAGDSLKYFAMKTLMKYDPNDPNAMKNAYAELNAAKPGQYELDAQDNLMLTGTADGYIGARPQGWGAGGAWFDRGQGNYQWQWLGYNSAHPGPHGEV